MSVDVRAGRAFEHSLRHRDDEFARLRQRPVRESYYATLMRVSYRHPYYNLMDKACPDFVVRPTAFSRELMASIGLLFKDEGIGFSVLYDVNRTQDLLCYLQHQGILLDGKGPQYWTRLSFALCSQNPYFINITDIPIDLSPTDRNFYFSNQSAHVEPGDEVILNPGPRVDAAQLLPLVSPQYAIPVPESVPGPLPNTVVGVEVQAISGEAVICEPRCVPDPAQPWEPKAATARCGEWFNHLPQPSPDRCRDVVYLDFSRLPEDKYAIAYVTKAGSMVPFGTRLYTMEAPTPMCFIDLLFSNPTGEADTVYPVALPAQGEGTIAGVDYILDFEARSTFWCYYIVPQAQDDDFEYLIIENLTPLSTVGFLGPARVTLPNGNWAYLFVSDQPLRLQQQSIYRFRLRGRGPSDIDERTVVDRLPVAAQQQVVPLTEPMMRLRLARSLHPDAEETEGGRSLIQRFFGGPGIEIEESLERLRNLRNAAATRARSTVPPRRGAQIETTTTISDIYVYV